MLPPASETLSSSGVPVAVNQHAWALRVAGLP